jgi:hypothetical protein
MAPETTNLQPITYPEAMSLYTANRSRPFSFIAAPYNVLKTITVENGHVLASHPDAARAHYDWIALHRAARGRV